MTRLEGTQLLLTGQLLWAKEKFSIGSGTSLGLGADDGGFPVGWSGWFPGGGAFFSYSVTPNFKLGFAMAANFGGITKYNEDWVGRYYVRDATLLGLSLLPSIAYKLTDKLSIGASLNAMYGISKTQVAINNIDPRFGDGQLKADDYQWGFGGNGGLLYEFTPDTRLGITYNSQITLDFSAPAQFSGLAPELQALLASRGLLNAKLDLGITVPQQVMGSVFSQLTDRWAVLGSVGWQQWSRFGQVQIGISDSTNPTNLTSELHFRDTWHVAAGAQYRLSDPWRLDFGVAYDSAFQSSSNVSPLLATNSAWRFGVGAQHQASQTLSWGVSFEYLYGGTLDTNLSSKPVALGGQGDLVGSYNNIGLFFVAANLNWKF